MSSSSFIRGYHLLPPHPLLALPENLPKLSSKPRTVHTDGLDWAFPPAWEAYAWSPSPSPSPSPSSQHSDPDSESESPRPQSTTGPHRTSKSTKVSRKGPDHIPRPPNPWIIFRSDFLARNPIVHQFENDHRQLSRIIADTWAEMDDAAKLPFRLLAKEAKEEHRRKHPNYRFKPTSRNKKTRQTNRNGALDLERNHRIACILSKGLDEDAVKRAVASLDEELERKRLRLEAENAARKPTQSRAPPLQPPPPTTISSFSPPSLPFPLHPAVSSEPIHSNNPLVVPPSLPATTVSPADYDSCESAFFDANAVHTWNSAPVAQPWDSSDSAWAEVMQAFNAQPFPAVSTYAQIPQDAQMDASFSWTSGQQLDIDISYSSVAGNIQQDPTFMQMSNLNLMGSAAPSQTMGFGHSGFEPQPNFPPLAFDLNAPVNAGDQAYFFGEQNFDFTSY